VRLRAGWRLASPALVADGNHARVDGFVSLAVARGFGSCAGSWSAMQRALKGAVAGRLRTARQSHGAVDNQLAAPLATVRMLLASGPKEQGAALDVEHPVA
jgi:hypothetical protein